MNFLHRVRKKKKERKNRKGKREKGKGKEEKTKEDVTYQIGLCDTMVTVVALDT